MIRQRPGTSFLVLIGMLLIGTLTVLMAWSGTRVPISALLWQSPPRPGQWTPAASTAGRPVAGETMRWRPVGIGGGGFVTGLSWDRSGATRVARTDVYGAYRWDAKADRWVQLVTIGSMPADLGIQAGVAEGVYEIAVAPSDPQRLYMATAGALFRSDDGSAHWVRVLGGNDKGSRLNLEPNSPYRFYGPFIAVSPDDPALVVFGSPDRGVWRSVDAGAHWSRIASIPPSNAISPKPGVQPPGIPLWFQPGAKPARLWAASAGNGVYTGTATGDDFRRVGGKDGPGIVRRAAFAGDGSFYAVESEAHRVWRFKGGAWTDLTSDIGAKNRDFAAVAIDPGRSAILIADQSGRLWCSSDNGASWAANGRSIRAGDRDPPWLRVANQPYFATADVAFDPDQSGRLWAATGTGVFTAPPRTGCANVAWESRTRGIEELVANDVVSAPGYAPAFAGWDFGIHVKEDLDGFSTGYGPRERVLIAAQQLDWTPARAGFLVTNASDTRMGCCAADGQSVLAGYSEDGGRTWQRFASLPTPPGTDPADPWRMSFGTIAVAADDPDNIVWEPAFNRSPFYTLDRGRTWTRIALPKEVGPKTGSFPEYFQQRKTLAADRVRPGTFYLLHSGDKPNMALGGLWRTEDRGMHWQHVYAGPVIPDSYWAAKLRVMPGHAGYLFVTSGHATAPDSRVRRSTDGGQSWTIMEGVDRVDDIGFGLAARGSNYPTIFLSGRVNGVFGVWRSIDNARTWQWLVDFPRGTLDQVTVVEGDKNVFGRVYLGYKGSGWIYGEPAACGAASAGFGCSAVK